MPPFWPEAEYYSLIVRVLMLREKRKVNFSDADPGPQDPVLWVQYTNIHRVQKSCGGKGLAWPPSKRERVRGLERAQERADPRLDRLLLLFWAHYMEDGPHLLCTGSPQVITF